MNIQTNGGTVIGGDVEAQTVVGRDMTVIHHHSSDRTATEQEITQARAAYLNWIIERNQYLDARGVSQTQRQVQLKLDEIYIGLQAQADERPRQADRRLQEEEIAELERSIELQALSPEEAEDRRDALLHRLDMRQEQPVSSTPISLSQATTQHRHLVILGDPGSGKTTLLRYLALQHAETLQQNLTEVQLYDQQGSKTQQPSRFPILIRIADYAEEERWQEIALSDFLPSYFERNECQPPGLAQMLDQELAQGGCLLLLDGLDEIVSADDRRGIVQKIENFVRHHAKGGQRGPNHFIITSRIAGYRSAPISGVGREPFAHFVVQEMDEPQMERFLERWCRAVEDAQTPDSSPEERQRVAQREVDGIMEAIQNNPGVKRLAANPLMLRTLALIHRTGARLPQKRVELYRLAADTLARTWRAAQGVPESVLVEDHYLTPLLGQLAYWMHDNKPTGIATEEEVYEQLGQAYCELRRLPKEHSDHPDVITEIKKFLQAVREHTGLFVERAPRRYGFMHLTFEEYYAARHLVARNRTRAKLIRKHLHQPRWEEPILLALGFVGLEYVYDAGDLLDSAILAQGEEAEELGLEPSEYEDLLGRDYLFALRCLGDQIPANPATLEGLMERLVGELLYGQGLARFSLYYICLNELLPLLKGSIAAVVSAPKFLVGIQNDDSNIRYHTADYLGKLGEASDEIIIALINALKDKDRNVCSHAVSSLGILGGVSNKAITALIVVLKEGNSEARRSAVASLGELGIANSEVIVVLIAALKDDEWHVRFYATISLGKLGASGSEVTIALINALKDDHWRVRSHAATSLGELGETSDETIMALIDALKDDYWNVRSNASATLVKLGKNNGKIIAELIVALNDGDSDTQCRAAECLARLDEANSEVIATLIYSLHNNLSDIRYRASTSLGELGEASSDVTTALIATLDDSSWHVRDSAIVSLGKLGEISNELTAAIVTALNSDLEFVRYCTTRSLSRLSQTNSQVLPALIAALITVLYDDDAYGRSTAASKLGELGEASSEVIKALVVALKDDDTYVRLNAATSLGKLGKTSDEVITALIITLKDDDWYVGRDAAASLGRLGKASGEVINALITALQDYHSGVRSNAAISLGELGEASKAVITALIAALKDKISDVRSSAAISLGMLGEASSEVICTLISTLMDDSGDVRYSAAQSLGTLGESSKEAISALISTLKDDEWYVRYSAAQSLGVLSEANTEVINALLSMFKDDSGNVRSHAAQSLGELGKLNRNESINGLISLIHDSDYTQMDSSGRTAQDYAYDALWKIVVG